jgi:hypothetical protein
VIFGQLISDAVEQPSNAPIHLRSKPCDLSTLHHVSDEANFFVSGDPHVLDEELPGHQDRHGGVAVERIV